LAGQLQTSEAKNEYAFGYLGTHVLLSRCPLAITNRPLKNGEPGLAALELLRVITSMDAAQRLLKDIGS